jgi:hypothetical protein
LAPLEQKNLLRRLYDFHHSRRFLWLRDKIAGLRSNSVSILELGCGDARSLDYVPLPVERYVGLDAAMMSGTINGKAYGLEAARQRFADRKGFRFLLSTHPRDVAAVQEKFDVALVMETFEYLGTANLEAYISALAGKLHPHGLLLATMPNEKGLPLLVKTLGAKLSGIPRSRFTASEFMNALLGRMDQVPRMERGRKGFDYLVVVALVQLYFRHVHLESTFSRNLPLPFSPTIGLIASQQTIDLAPS